MPARGTLLLEGIPWWDRFSLPKRSPGHIPVIDQRSQVVGGAGARGPECATFCGCRHWSWMHRRQWFCADPGRSQG